MTSRFPLPLLVLGSLAALTGACTQILGLDKFNEGTAGTGGAGTTGTTTTTGGGGTGGMPITCSPGEVKACPYTGPGMTENKGACRAGTQTCLPNGSGFGACEGEVTPITEDCATQADDDCDGEVNQASAGCVCTPNDAELCYDGDPSTQHQGTCADGHRSCAADGRSWSACTGQVLPVAEDCAMANDENCDGKVNEGCACTPGGTDSCYSGSAQTENQGICTAGTYTCNPDGLGFGPCMGEVLPMASDDCANALDDDCSGTYCTQVVWTKTYAGGSAVTDLVTDAAGNTYVVGAFNGSFPIKNPPLISAGGIDGFAAKLDPNGATVWAIQFGDVSNQFGTGIALDSAGNVILTGYFTRSVTFGATTLGGLGNDSDQILVAKVDNSGNAIWAKQYGDPPNASVANQRGLGVRVDSSDNIVVVGEFNNSADLGTGSIAAKGGTDAFVAKIAPAGTTTFAKTYGAVGVTTSAGHVAVDPAGNIAVTGTFTGSVNFGFGGPTSAFASGPDAFLLRLTPNGSSSWVKSYGNGKKAGFSDVQMDSVGNVILSGAFQGFIDLGGAHQLSVPNAGSQANFFLAQLNSAGFTSWAIQLGNSVANPAGNSAAGAFSIGPGGTIVLSGICYSSFDLGFPLSCGAASPSPFLLQISAAGVPQWGRTYGAGAIGRSFYLPTGDFAVITAVSQGALNLGSGVIPGGSVVGKIATK